MGYEQAIEAAGATIHEIESFGDYQGTTWAKVSFQGVTGWISYSFGSCSGCDSYEGWVSDLPGYREPTPDELAAFGKDYLGDIMPQDRAETEAAKYAEWDSEAEKVLAFIRAHA